MALNDRQRRFAAEYVADCNATQAAIRAGYSKKTANEQGCRLLANVNIQAEIEKRLQKPLKKLEVTQERIVAELARIAFSDIKDVAKWGKSGV